MTKAGAEDWKTPLGVYERAIAELRRTREEIQSELQNLKQVQASLLELPKLKADFQSSQIEIQALKAELQTTKEELAATQKVANEAQSPVDNPEREASATQKELQTLKELMADELNRNNQIVELLTKLQQQLSDTQKTNKIPEADEFKMQVIQSLSELGSQISQLHDELTLFSPASGLDYFKLRDLLEAKKWKEADRETYTYILRISDREREQWLNDEHIKQFPSHDLRIIDRLWLKYSDGKFGFSVQKRFWQEFNEDYKRFGDRVRWLVNLEKSEWRRYQDYIFDLDAPEGHLPSIVRIIGLDYREKSELPHRLRLFLSKCWVVQNY